MSEEIMFSDMLNHYSLKLTEISDMLADMVGYLNKAILIVNDCWSSQAANVFNEKVSESQRCINKSNVSLDELLKLLNSVKNETLDDEINQLNQNIENT